MPAIRLMPPCPSAQYHATYPRIDVSKARAMGWTTDDHLVVTLGMQDCIVVHTPDATLVARKSDEESIRKVVNLIEQKGWEEYL